MVPCDFLSHVQPMMNYSLIQKTWLEKSCEPICTKSGLKLKELQILMLLYVNKSIQTANDIEKISEMKRANISILVESLCKGGFIEQQSVENDRRMKKLVFTEKSKDVLNEIDEIINNLISNTFSGIDENDLHTCEKVFNQMYANLLKATENK